MHRKTAIVTGASEGIGREFCRQLADDGYVIFAVARNSERLKSLIEELSGEGHGFLAVDLAHVSGWTELTKHMISKHYDLLVNNAGFGTLTSFDAMTETSAQDMLALNCSSLMALSHCFLRQAKSGDALINVASILAYAPSPFVSVYAATKAFVATLSEALWFEQKPRGVYVMNLCPGSTSTEFHTRAGMARSDAPRFMVQMPSDVVEAAMSALQKRTQLTVIPGIFNKVLVLMFRILPRRITISILGQGRSAAPRP